MEDATIHVECGFRIVTPPEVQAARNIASSSQFTFLSQSDARTAIADLMAYVRQMPIAQHLQPDRTVSDRITSGWGPGAPLSPEFVGLSEAEYVRTSLAKRLRSLAASRDKPTGDLEDVVMEILATQEQASDSLRRYGMEAEAHFRSTPYLADVEKLREAVQGIHGLHIGLDLEGVLVNLNPLSRMDPNTIRMWTVLDAGLQSQRMKWIFRRPLAKEWISMLAEHNSVDICTAVPHTYALAVLEQTGIDLPPDSKLVARDELEIATGNQRRIARRLDELMRDPSQSDELSGRAITNAYNGRIKIPSLFNYDVIIDDNAQMHKRACELLGYPEDAAKILDVPPFQFRTAPAFMTLFRERGILDITHRLQDFCTQQK